jgi:hypothetical protein
MQRMLSKAGVTFPAQIQMREVVLGLGAIGDVQNLIEAK